MAALCKTVILITLMKVIYYTVLSYRSKSNNTNKKSRKINNIQNKSSTSTQKSINERLFYRYFTSPLCPLYNNYTKYKNQLSYAQFSPCFYHCVLYFFWKHKRVFVNDIKLTPTVFNYADGKEMLGLSFSFFFYFLFCSFTLLGSRPHYRLELN